MAIFNSYVSLPEGMCACFEPNPSWILQGHVQAGRGAEGGSAWIKSSGWWFFGDLPSGSWRSVIISNNHRDYNPNADNTLGIFFRDTGDYLGLLGIIWDNYSIIIPNSHQLTGLLNSETSRNLRQLFFFSCNESPKKSLNSKSCRTSGHPYIWGYPLVI